MDQLGAIRAFIKVAEAGSFTRAAEQLELSASSMTRTVSDLEEKIGTRLLHRTTRKLALTEAGKIYLERCRNILQDLDEVDALVGSNATRVSGKLRLVAPALFAMRKLPPVLAAFQAAYPDVTIEMVLADRNVDLIEEEFDLGILAAARLTGMTLVSRHLTSTDYYACASPEYIARHGQPTHPSDLERHACLVFRTEHAGDEVVFRDLHEMNIVAHPKVTFLANNIGMVRAAALAGMGIATLSAYLVDDDIRSGRLMRVLPEYQLPGSEFRVVYSSRKFLSAKVKAFVDLAVSHFETK